MTGRPTIPDEEVHEVETRVAQVESGVAVGAPDLPATRAEGISPFDLDPADFKKALDRRRDNRKVLLEWIASELKPTIDYGAIHVVSKQKCDKGRFCTNPNHFSKPSLFKPGAEKICSMLGLTARFPNAGDYEQRALRGETINIIVLRCELVSGSGVVVSEGMGARIVANDGGDINKSLKMAEKSGQIDATIRLGLSDTYTQDLEDMVVVSGEEDSEAGHGSSHPASGTQASDPARPQNKAIDYVNDVSCDICGGPVVRQFSPKSKKYFHSCEMAQGNFHKDPEMVKALKDFERDNPPLAGKRHYWVWEEKA